jgi:hypothetical protein
MKNVLLIILIFLSTISFGAENVCNDALYTANKLYEEGKFKEAVTLLEPCLNSNSLVGNEKFDATRLLALCFINLNQMESAEIYVQRMLNLRSDYQMFHYVDPKQLTSLLNQYQVEEKLYIGGQAGLAMTQAKILKNYSPANTPSTYYSQFALSVGAMVEYKFGSNTSVLIQPSFSGINYQRELENVAGSKKLYSEQLAYFCIPLSARYYTSIGPVPLFAQAGFEAGNLIHSFADVQSTKLLDGSILQSSTETTDYRNKFLYGFNIGLGTEYVVGKLIVGANISYKQYIPNAVLADRRYDNVDFILSAQYLDSDLTFNSLGLNLTVKHPILHNVHRVNK